MVLAHAEIVTPIKGQALVADDRARLRLVAFLRAGWFGLRRGDSHHERQKQENHTRVASGLARHFFDPVRLSWTFT
jgi:hypothetical protein